jgi:hypothetical protein
MRNWISAAWKAAIPFATIAFLTAYAQQVLSWAAFLLACMVVGVVFTLLVIVSIALAHEKVLKSLISLIKAVKH